MRKALGIVLEPRHLRQTVPIMLAVGTVLAAIKSRRHADRGDATGGTYLKVAITFLIPFVVSNLGLLAGKRAEGEL